jgi:hypothetical protein
VYFPPPLHALQTYLCVPYDHWNKELLAGVLGGGRSKLYVCEELHINSTGVTAVPMRGTVTSTTPM